MIWLRKVVCDFALSLLSRFKTHRVIDQVVDWVKAHESEIGAMLSHDGKIRVGKGDIAICSKLQVVKISLPGGKELEVPFQFLEGCYKGARCLFSHKCTKPQEP